MSFDHFGRTSSSQNHALTQSIAGRLIQNGFIEQKTVRLPYSPTDGRFLPDRYVLGTCPKCHHRDARGDQCDACGALIDAGELIGPRSAISGARDVELRETTHLYLRLSEPGLQLALRKWLDARAPKWGTLAAGIAYKHLDEGLIDRCITRDLQWGVRVGGDDPEVSEKVFYVWFDAPLGYIAATLEHDPDALENWWAKDQDVEYVQFMGKDNVAFHTTTFPAALLGADGGYGPDIRTVDRLKAFNWLNWYGDKFSTTDKRGIFMDKALDIAPADVWRWYLSINAPENSDTSFTWERFQIALNNDLADTLGNFVSRVVGFTRKHYEGSPPEPGRITDDEVKLRDDLRVLEERYVAELEAIEIGKAAKTLRDIWARGNEYFAHTTPWAQEGERKDRIIAESYGLIRLYARLSHPFIPFTAAVLTEIGNATNVNELSGILFTKLPDIRRQELEAEFG